MAFNALPVRLALATLEKVRSSGPGSKISRLEVRRIVTALSRAIERGRPAVPLAAWPRGEVWSDDWAPAAAPVS